MKALIRFTAVICACVFGVNVNAASTQMLSDIVVYPERTAPATVISLNDSLLSAQIEARVIAVHARVSQTVKQGDVLVQLECADYDLSHESALASLDSAVSRVALAKSQQVRADSLLEKKLLSQEQWDARSNELHSANALRKQAQVVVKQAALRVNRCQIKAPFDGVVTQRFASVGQLAAVGAPMVQLVDTSGLEVSANVPYQDAELFDRAMRFALDYGKRVYLELAHVGSVINSTTRSQEVRLTFADGESAPAGAAGKLIWRDPRPFIPATYIVQRSGKRGVFLQVDGRAEFHHLSAASPGRDTPTMLPLDSLIVTDGVTDIEPGDAL